MNNVGGKATTWCSCFLSKQRALLSLFCVPKTQSDDDAKIPIETCFPCKMNDKDIALVIVQKSGSMTCFTRALRTERNNDHDWPWSILIAGLKIIIVRISSNIRIGSFGHRTDGCSSSKKIATCPVSARIGRYGEWFRPFACLTPSSCFVLMAVECESIHQVLVIVKLATAS